MNTFVIRVLSDLHLEFEDYKIKINEPDNVPEILILAGDISPDLKQATKLIEDYLTSSNENNIVLFVLGNHDYYEKTLANTVTYWRDLETNWAKLFKAPQNSQTAPQNCSNRFHFLHNNYVELYNTIFWGSTFWTNFNELDKESLELTKMFIADYRTIYNDYNSLINCNDIYKEHKIAKDSLENTIKYCEKLNESSKFVKSLFVITHHLPTFKSSHPRFKGKQNKLNYAYASDNLDHIIENKVISHWVHGHTHDSYDYEYLNTRIICNPKGIRKENKNFDDLFIKKVNKKPFIPYALN
jgi:predicted phosphodiesterase